MSAKGFYVVKNKKVFVKEYQDHIEIFMDNEKLCDVAAVRFKNETHQYKETLITLAVQSKMEEMKQREVLNKAIEQNGGDDRWLFMN